MNGTVRIAVTGLGVKSSAGTDVESFWRRLCEGRSTAGRITLFDPGELAVDFGCQVTGLEVDRYFSAKETDRVDRVTHLGVAAATDALEDAGPLGVDPFRFAAMVGTGQGGPRALELQSEEVHRSGYGRVSPLTVSRVMINATTALICMRHQIRGPSMCIATACASAAHAIGEGMRLIREGAADVVVAGGTEAPLAKLTISAFYRMGAVSRRREDPEHACRPFDVDRDGMVVGEGAGFLVLERWDRAVARDAHIYAELAGYGRTSDAYHITAPAPDGSGAQACMLLALADANLTPQDVTHINAHGTSTPLNDATEAAAISSVFGAYGCPVTATKSIIGHTCAAGGAIEAVAALMTLREGIAHPTANLENLDPRCEVDVIAGAPRKIAHGAVLSNSFGFGGHNASLVFAPAGS